MNTYFDDLYNDVYEYAYDTITEKKNVTTSPSTSRGKKKHR